MALLLAAALATAQTPAPQPAGPGVTASPTSLTIDEGDSAPYTVRLDTRPAGTVTVTVTGGAPGVVAVSPRTLTFDAQTWNTTQTVTVTLTY